MSTDRQRVSQIDDQSIGELVTGLEAQLPVMLQGFADLLGRSAPRVSAEERRRFMSRLRRKLQALWRTFADLEALGAAPESSEKGEKAKAAVRSIFTEMLVSPISENLRMRTASTGSSLSPQRQRIRHPRPGRGRPLTWKRARTSGIS